MADKIVKAFEALRNHYLQESTQTLAQPTSANSEVAESPGSLNKKKDLSLSSRERINYCNAIADFLPMQTVKDINEFPRLLTLAMELLLVCCDDNEGDVRLVAGECINKIMKAFLDSNIGRIQVELYKEIKKNGTSRSLRAAMQRFGDTCHLIRAHKCRPYVANLLPCIVKLAKRSDDNVQEMLGVMMSKICPVLGKFMTEPDVKILLKNFLPNLKLPSAVARRTAASVLNSLCQNSWKQIHFYSWLISMLLGMITPLTEELPSHTILGVLQCFRNIVPHLADLEQESGMKGSFGARKSAFSPSHDKDRVIEKKQFLQIYEVTMFCTKHKDHNVVTAALENLYQILICPAKPLLEILLSPNGIAPTITGQLASFSDENDKNSPQPSEAGDTSNISEMGDSGISDLQSVSSMSGISDNLSEKDPLGAVEGISLAESSLGEAGQSLDSALYSAIPEIPTLQVSQYDRSYTDVIDEQGDSLADEEEEEGLRLPRTYTQGSMVDIEAPLVSFQRDHLGSAISDIADNTSQTSIDQLYRIESVSSADIRAVIERQFNFDAVACTGVPALHCVRLMCSFLLAGEPGKLLPDLKTRVTVKSLALYCISAAIKLFPESIYATVVPDEYSKTNMSIQLVRDILLFKRHSDPQIRGVVAGVIGQFIASVSEISNGNISDWNLSMMTKYATGSLDFKECIDILLAMFGDESAITIKQSCLAAKFCLLPLSQSSYNVYSYEIAWKLLSLYNSPYWLVKVEIMSIFQQLDYKLMLLLEKQWIMLKDISKLNIKYIHLQNQVVNGVLLKLLGDEDARVRYMASVACVKIIPNLYCAVGEPLNVSLSELLNGGNQQDLSSEPTTKYDNRLKGQVENNLSFVIRKINELMENVANKYLTVGCTRCLFLLSEAYPVLEFPYAWEAFPTYEIKTLQEDTKMRPGKTLMKPVRQLDFNPNQCISFGILNTVFDLISSSWITLDLQAHQEALKLCVHLLCGTSYRHLRSKADEKTHQNETEVEKVVGEQPWALLEHIELMSMAKKVFMHITRILYVLTFVIEQINPMSNIAKLQFGFQNKDKTPIPGIATAASPASQNASPASTTSTNVPGVSPRKFTLSKAIQKKQESESESSKSAENTPTSESKVTSQTTPSNSDKNEKPGIFQHIPHFLKLYEVLKGAFKNYQVLAVSNVLDKFSAFVRGVLESLSLLLELATFNEISGYAEDFLEYLQATARVEEEGSFLVVQQLLKALFGTNVASQPDVFKLAKSAKDLVATFGDPTFVYSFNTSYVELNESSPDLYHSCFLTPYNELCESLKIVPLVDSTTSDRGSRAISFIKNVKKHITIPHRPTAKVSKERISSIQSYIRLFEPLVIHALKSYTTTSSTHLQCQAIHLLDQLIRLRVNYSLLDSDQVFIGFVLKQFDFIESGQILHSELFIPTVFQFLVLLSYECYQPKFTQAKAIIGMPRIIKLCDDIMACGQPAITHAIPALKPIVQDLFSSPSQVRADTGKDLDTQREVVVSMLLRVIQYPDVLCMLTQVLNGCKSDNDKWKRLSRQIIDTLLPNLSKLEVQIRSMEDLNCLYSLLDAVAPLSLRPADIILKALFDVRIPICDHEVIKILSMAIALLRTLIMQNSEDIIFSRMQQIDPSYIRASFSLTQCEDQFLLKTKKNEQAAAVFFSSFLVYILHTAVEELLHNEQKLIKNQQNAKTLRELTETYLMLFVFIGKHGNFKKLSSNLLSLLFTPMESSNQKDLSVLRCITRKLSLLKSNEPVCFLKWLYVLRTLGVSDMDFWKEFYDVVNVVDNNDVKHLKWIDSLIDNGSLLLYCDVIVSKLKEQKNVDYLLVSSILNIRIKDIILNINELPIKELICLLLKNSKLTGVFIKSISDLVLAKKFTFKPSILKVLLHLLECVDLAHSAAIVQLLFLIIPCIKVYGIARRAETLACRRIEYLQSLAVENNFNFNELVSFTKNTIFSKRYPRLCSLIQRITKCDASTLPQSVGTHPLDSAVSDIKKYAANKDWMYTFVQSVCFSETKSSTQSRSTVRLLRSLNLQDIESIMMNEKFDINLLETCISEARLSEHHTRINGRTVKTRNHGLELLSLYDTGGSSESENKNCLLMISKMLVLKHVTKIIEMLKDTTTYESVSYVQYNNESLKKLFNDKDLLNKCFLLSKCLMCFLRASCRYNQIWNLLIEDTYNVMMFLLILPRICLLNLECNDNNLEYLELCLECLALLFHCQEFSVCLSTQLYSYLLCDTVTAIHTLVVQMTLRYGDNLVPPEKASVDYQNTDESTDSLDGKDVSPFKKSCERVSEMVHSLRTTLSIDKSVNSTIPKFLIGPLRQVITGLARIPFVNSYARIPPIVWKFGWVPTPEGVFQTELPPLPVDILKEKDVLQEFVFRVNHIGWTSRMQFEETWAALLGVLSSPPILDENTSPEEEIELAQASCLAVHCITSLLLDTTLAPVPGNPAISQYSVIHRQKDYPFLGSKAGKKLHAIRQQIELMFYQSVLFNEDSQTRQILHPIVPNLLSARQRKQQLLYGCMMEGKLFVTNLETPCDLKNFTIGQIAASAIRTRLVTTDVQEDTDSDDSDSLIIKVKEKSPVSNQPSTDTYKKLEELDIRSCLQFLLELFEQWLSPYAVPKTPLMLKMEAVKALCILSDLLLELTHYEWVLGILSEFTQNHPMEDDILMEYLIPTMSKALAVLKLEGSNAEKICKHLEISLRSPHIPLQVSCLIGSFYILDSYVTSTNLILVPILTEYITRKLSSVTEISNISSHRYMVVLWSLAFYLVENCSSEIQDPHFATLVLESAVKELCKSGDETSHAVHDVLFRGLERLAVSFSLTRPECDRLAKIACSCVSAGKNKKIISALGLLCTCMYTGKDAEQASGLSTIDYALDAPINDSRLVVMERINVLLTRIRKGQMSEATLLATVLPRILLDFLPVQEVMNKLISEFLSSQQPRPELIAKIFNKVSDLLYKDGEELLVREWVFLCIGSFVQRTPLSMAVWSLSCFFISASSNPWLKSIFPFLVERKGMLEEDDREIFCMAALDFYLNQNLDASHRKQFIQTFQSKADNLSSPYEKLISCCLQSQST